MSARGPYTSFCNRRRFCLQAGSFYHPSLAAPFRFLDELGHPAGVRVRRVEREPKIRKQPVFQLGGPSSPPRPASSIHHRHGTSFPCLTPSRFSIMARWFQISGPIACPSAKITKSSSAGIICGVSCCDRTFDRRAVLRSGCLPQSWIGRDRGAMKALSVLGKTAPIMALPE